MSTKPPTVYADRIDELIDEYDKQLAKEPDTLLLADHAAKRSHLAFTALVLYEEIIVGPFMADPDFAELYEDLFDSPGAGTQSTHSDSLISIKEADDLVHSSDIVHGSFIKMAEDAQYPRGQWSVIKQVTETTQQSQTALYYIKFRVLPEPQMLSEREVVHCLIHSSYA